jgi:hypothetical protein
LYYTKGKLMRFSVAINEEVGRLLNGKGKPEEGGIGHLATAAGRAAESLEYLVKN